jgi:hypothetical protein
MSDIAHKVNLGKMGVDVTEPIVSLTKEEYEAKYGKIDDKEEDDIKVVDLNQLQSLVRKTLVKLLLRPAWLKGYVQNVKKDADIADDPNTDMAVKDEVEQSISEMVSMFRKKYKVK